MDDARHGGRSSRPDRGLDPPEVAETQPAERLFRRLTVDHPAAAHRRQLRTAAGGGQQIGEAHSPHRASAQPQTDLELQEAAGVDRDDVVDAGRLDGVELGA